MVLTSFDAREALTLRQAAEIATVSKTTITRWCNEFGIGRKIGGGWRVSRVALQMKLDDNGPALMAYLDGDRTSQLLERRRAFLVLGVQLRDGLNGFFDVSREDRGSVGLAHVSC
jgi:Helix-turn-helix domain